MAEKTIEEIKDAYNRQVEGARKGGKAEKHFTPESKARQVAGCRKGGKHSHTGQGNNKE